MARIESKKHRQRRDFLKSCAAISLLGSGAGAMNGKLGLIGSALAQSSAYASLNDYKALVCVFLYGGSDSFSMFLPADQGIYESFAASRSGLAIPQSGMFEDVLGSGIRFNTLMPGLNALYNTGQLAVVGNVGNLITPVTKADYTNPNAQAPIPNDLFAHNHQQEQWLKGLSSSPASVTGSGWGGRMADLLQHANAGAGLPPSFSVAGSNYWLPGQQVQPMGLNPNNGLSPLTYLDNQTGLAGNAARETTLDEILNINSNHPLKQQAARSLSRAKDGAAQLVSTINANNLFADSSSQDPISSLNAQLRMVARLIAGQSQLGMRRQIFFVGAGGWDTHDNQTARLNGLLADLDNSLTEFQTTIDELSMSDSVTTFTASDFGRTLTINGDGCDHGWGGHCMVMGGAVNGGQLYGQLPNFDLGSEDDSGTKGRIIPKLSINQYGAVLAQWMGVTQSDLSTIFPDLENFGSDWQNGLGFMV